MSYTKEFRTKLERATSLIDLLCLAGYYYGTFTMSSRSSRNHGEPGSVFQICLFLPLLEMTRGAISVITAFCNLVDASFLDIGSEQI